MDILYRIFGPPHELLHVLALFLIGKRPKSIGYRHVDIPDDLSKVEYVFVAGLPALVFWGIAIVVALKMVNASSLGEGLILFVAFSLASFAGLGTLGDIELIVRRIKQ